MNRMLFLLFSRWYRQHYWPAHEDFVLETWSWDCPFYRSLFSFVSNEFFVQYQASLYKVLGARSRVNVKDCCLVYYT